MQAPLAATSNFPYHGKQVFFVMGKVMFVGRNWFLDLKAISLHENYCRNAQIEIFSTVFRVTCFCRRS